MLYPAELRAPGRAIAAAMRGRQASVGRAGAGARRWSAVGGVDGAGAAARRRARGGGRGIVPPGRSERSAEGLAPVDPEAVALDRHGRLRAQLRAAGWRLAAGGAGRARARRSWRPADDVAGGRSDRAAARWSGRLGRRARASGPTARTGPGRPSASRRGVASFVLVRGTVRAAGAARRLHLSRLRRGLATRLHAAGGQPRPRPASPRAGLDVAGLPGRRILARGWLFESAGPMIELVHPAQIEVEE